MAEHKISVLITRTDDGGFDAQITPEDLELAIGDTVTLKVSYAPDIAEEHPAVQIKDQTFPLNVIATPPTSSEETDEKVATSASPETDGHSFPVPDNAEEGEHEFRIMVGTAVARSGRVRIIRQHG